MTDTVAVFPAACEHDPSFAGVQAEIRTLCGGEPRWFFYSPDRLMPLKNLLSEKSFSLIVLGFLGLDGAMPAAETVRSLGIHARLLVYRPALSADTADTAQECTGLARWRSQGGRILLNMCRLADAVFVDNEQQAAQVRACAPGLPVSVGVSGPADGIFGERAGRKVSIVILTFNQLDQTRQCVESLLKHTRGNYELIFVDNGSTDDTRAYLESVRQSAPNVTVIINSENLGFARANNQGMRVATGDYMLLLNNDVILTEGWLERMLACAESDPETGVVGPSTNHAVGQQVLDVDIPLEDGEIQRFAALQSIKNAGSWFESHRIIGFCMLIKREVVERAGMLDEAFGPGGFEDFDYCLRVHQAGYKIMITSDVFVYHIGGQGYVRNNLNYDKLRARNVEIFIDKWCRRALEILERLPNGA